MKKPVYKERLPRSRLHEREGDNSPTKTCFLSATTKPQVTATSMGNNSYSYDANGNQITRNIYNDGSYSLLYDAENRLVEVKKNSLTVAEFTYNGDG